MVRKATVSDAAKIADLDSRMFEDSLDFNFIHNDLSNNPMAYYFVYEEENNIIGYINCWVSDNTEILNFCVEPDHRKKGIGSKLFNEVERIASGVISLEVRVSNTNAIEFYSNRGFKKALIRKGYYSNGEDAILMVRM